MLDFHTSVTDRRLLVDFNTLVTDTRLLVDFTLDNVAET